MSAYLITRDGQELGSFEASQIQEGLQTGFFQATDWGWREGMPGWQGLSEIIGGATSTKPASAAPRAKPIASPASIGRTKQASASAAGINPYAAPTAKTQGGAVGAVPFPIVAELTGTRPWVRFISILMWIICSVVILGVVLALVFGLLGAGAIAGSDAKAGAVGFGAVLMMAVGYGLTAMLIIYPTLKLSKYASNISRLAASQSFSDLAAALAEQRRFWKFYGILTLIYLSFALLFVLLGVVGIGLGGMSR
jgi:hypothetical protein